MKSHTKSNQKEYVTSGQENNLDEAVEFSDSPMTEKIMMHLIQKFPKTVAQIAFFKCLAVVSCKLERPRVSILHVSPSRHLKSYSSNEAMKLFDTEFLINTRSDFTIHSLEKYKESLNEGRCLFVNDGTTLFASKAKRTKDRLVGGLSELLADEVYTYQDFNRKFSLRGKVTLVMNITSEAYKNYQNRLFGLTFAERVLTMHNVLTEPEMEAWVAKEEKSQRMRFEDKITLDDIETNVESIPHKYLKLIQREARDFSYLSLKGFVGCQDIIKGLMRTHASLNKRRGTCDDDLDLLSMAKNYLANPFSPYDGKIVKYASQGVSYRTICKNIGKPESYVKQVRSVVERARIRGIIPLEQGTASISFQKYNGGV
jgi:hypothetical protein